MTILAGALAVLPGLLYGQQDDRPNRVPAPQSAEVRRAAREVSLALANLIPAAEAARARSGHYQADVVPVAGGEAAVVAIVDLAEFGWNAIGIHRRVEGVTCTIRVGTTGPLLGGPGEGWDPWCIDPTGEPLAPEVKADDRQRVRWWYDPFLDRAPERKACPALSVPRLPTRNDTLYLSFLLDEKGRVAAQPVIVESTGSLVEASAAIWWLARCRFSPAIMQGRAVRSFVHLAYPLAPSHPVPPEARPPRATAEPRELALARWHAGTLARLLSAVAAAQEDHHAATGRYAPTLAGLSTPRFTSDSGIWFAMAEATDSGFRAVAVRRSAPDVVCTLLVIGSPSPVPRTACRESASGRDVTPGDDASPRPPTSSAYRAAAGANDTAGQPPMRLVCEPLTPLRDTPASSDAMLEFVVDTTGRPEPRSLRVLESSSLPGAATAVRVLAGCRYQPGIIGGQPVRVLVRQPIMVRRN